MDEQCMKIFVKKSEISKCVHFICTHVSAILVPIIFSFKSDLSFSLSTISSLEVT